MATTIDRSPLLKSKFLIKSRSALVIIKITPVREKITPMIWKIFVFSIFNIEEIKIIQTGIFYHLLLIKILVFLSSISLKWFVINS